MTRFARAVVALIAALAISSCVLSPGKFVSKLVVNADRSFSFSYIGEVYAIDMDDAMTKGMGDGPGGGTDSGTPDPSSYDDSDTPTFRQIVLQADDDATKAKTAAEKKAASDTKNKAIAEALSKEAGYRKAVYLGDGKFDIDYAISGTLTHNFIYPFNIDAEAVFPFIALELRGNNTVRMKAPGFANEGDSKNFAGADQAPSKMDGVFTLDTNAEIVSQNSEDGATTTGARKVITWKATPASKTAPMAVLRFAAK